MKFTRFVALSMIFCGAIAISGCSGGKPPEEASGEPVPADYAEQQKAAQEAAMKAAQGKK